jgi:transcriptional regulator with XRE-family HTH domain
MGRASRPKPKFLAKKLRQIRDSLNLSQTEMLIKLGYPSDKKEFRSIVSAYELGKREPTLIDLLKYSRLANISVEKIIDDEIELYE